MRGGEEINDYRPSRLAADLGITNNTNWGEGGGLASFFPPRPLFEGRSSKRTIFPVDTILVTTL